MSARLGVADLVRFTGGRLVAGRFQADCRGVTIDSRRVEPGQLFVAIRGPVHDGHAFLADAAKAGASALLVRRGTRLPPELPGGAAVVEVDDTTRALGALAAGHRERFRGPLIAITGSNGKSTTKEMCAAMLSVGRRCLKTEGNLNNQYGLPLTLLRLDDGHGAAVVELGTNAPGEIALLADIARPTVGVITNVGTAHAERLGSRDAIAREKGSLFEALGSDGVAVANAEDALVLGQLARTRARPVRFGRATPAEVRGEQVRPLEHGGFAFELVSPEGRAEARVMGEAETAVLNALAAAAAALAAGASLAEVTAGLRAYRPMHGRLERRELASGGVLLDDTYNANPQSMEVALRALARLKGRGRGVAVLGDMGELGDGAPEAHRRTGHLAAELGLDYLFALGDHAEEVVAGAVEAGMEPARIRSGRDAEAAALWVRGLLRGADCVLVKGSRAMRMERVVEALCGGNAG
jgi:UDP-N-acetylmuramoyl-tripeptide--D-alanyl-D-alanine ligase